MDNDGDGLIDFPADPGCVRRRRRTTSAGRWSATMAIDDDSRTAWPTSRRTRDATAHWTATSGPPPSSATTAWTTTWTRPIGLPRWILECNSITDPERRDRTAATASTTTATACWTSPTILGCENADWTPPRPLRVDCDDGVDNDGDGLVDHTADPGCASASGQLGVQHRPSPATTPWTTISTASFIDYPEDPGCSSPTDPTEEPDCSDGDGQ